MLTERQFSKIYQEYYKRSFLFVRLYVRDDLVAEDVVSEALIKLWEISRKEEIENTQAFLMTILKNKALDFLRIQKRKEKAIDGLGDWYERELSIRINNLEACDPKFLLTNEIETIVQETLNGLSEQTQQIFTESHLEGKSLKEIANELNLSVKGVDYHISKALKILRIALKDYMPFLLFVYINGSI